MFLRALIYYFYGLFSDTQKEAWLFKLNGHIFTDSRFYEFRYGTEEWMKRDHPY